MISSSALRAIMNPAQPTGAPATYQGVIAQAQGAPPSGLSEILEEIKKAMAGISPSAPVTEVDLIGQQPGVADLIKQLGLDRDWDVEAERQLAERGMAKPVAPEPQKPGIGLALAALGPALGAIFGGQPAMAAPGAAAVLGGYRGAWKEKQASFEKERDKYVEASAALADRLQGRAQQQASMLLPYFSLTAGERANARISVQQLNVALKGLDLQGQQVALQGFKIGLDAQQMAEDNQYRRNALVLDALKAIDAKTADALRLELERDRLAQQKENDAQRIVIEKGQLGVSWYNAKTQREAARSRAGGTQSIVDGVRDAIIADLFVKARKGDPDARVRMEKLVFGASGAPGDLTEAEKSRADAYLKATASPAAKTGRSAEQIEAMRQDYNVVARKYGWVEAPPGHESPGLKAMRWFRGFVGI